MIPLRFSWPSLCTIQTITYINTPGQRVPSGGTDVPNLIDIPCRIASLREAMPSDVEKMSATVISMSRQRKVYLDGYYPTIQAGTMRAVVDGVPYLIRGVDSDSERVFTRLFLEIILPRSTGWTP
jgi:hypothetical protein